MSVRRIIAFVLSLFVVLLGHAHASDDLQYVNLGPHLISFPKTWLVTAGVTAGGDHGLLVLPSGSPLDAGYLSFNSTRVWQTLGMSSLFPDVVTLTSLKHGTAPFVPVDKQRFDLANSFEADSYGFVDLAEPSQLRAQQEIYVYKGYQNDFGSPFIVQISTMEFLPIARVTFALNSTLRINYRFNSRSHSERSWRDMYQQVLDFIVYLQTPK